MSEDFHAASERARNHVGDRVWDAMSQHDRATAIYEELRALDAERVAQRATDDPEEKEDDAPPDE